MKEDLGVRLTDNIIGFEINYGSNCLDLNIVKAVSLSLKCTNAALSNDVTAKCHRGCTSRARQLLDKHNERKKRMRHLGN